MSEPNTASECRARGLEVGDTIEGTEYWRDGQNCRTRLTLLWLGKEVAVWRVVSKASYETRWSVPREAANWTLSCRDWRIVPYGKLD